MEKVSEKLLKAENLKKAYDSISLDEGMLEVVRVTLKLRTEILKVMSFLVSSQFMPVFIMLYLFNTGSLSFICFCKSFFSLNLILTARGIQVAM